MTVNLEVFNRFFGPFVAVNQAATQAVLRSGPDTLEGYYGKLAAAGVFTAALLVDLDTKIKAFNATLEKIDVVCVQEDILVLKDGTLTPLLKSIAGIPLISSCTSHVFGWALTINMYGAGGHLGNSIYSRVGGENVPCEPLADMVNGLPRCYAMFETTIGGRKITIASVHLSGGRDDDKAALLTGHTTGVKTRQVTQVMSKRPTIICGDFNTQPPAAWIRIRYGYFKTLLNYMFADPKDGQVARDGLAKFTADKGNQLKLEPVPGISYYDQIIRHPLQGSILALYIERYERWMHELNKVFTDNGYVYTNSDGKITHTSAFGGCVDGIFALPEVRCENISVIENSMTPNPKFSDPAAGVQTPFTPYYTDHFPVVAIFSI